MASQYQPANISDNDLEEIQSLEQNLDKVIVAVEQQPAYASLSDGELSRLQQAEQQLGVVMLAYDQN